MKKIISGLTAGCVFAALLFTGCSDSDDGDSGVVTKPVVKFETASDANLVKAVITSDIDLKSVVVSTSWGTGADAHSETVATITSFDNPKSYTYENRFTVPSGYLEMIVSVKAENTRNLSTTVTTKLQGEIAITMTDVIDAMSAAFREWESTGAMPESVSIQGFPFPKAQYFEYAARTFFNLYTGKTDNPVVVGTYLDAEDNERPDTFEQDEISKNMLNDALTKMINYAASNGMYPNYASYGTVAIAPYEGPDGVAYEGYFTYRRAVVCVARMLDYYKTHNALGNISSAFRIIQAYVPAPAGTFTKTALVDALSAAYAQWESGGTMPETITVNTSSLDKVQYFHAAIKVLLNAKNNDNSDIEVLTYLMPDNPARDSYDKETVSVFAGAENGAHTEDLANIAQRMLSYAGTPATGNGYFSNYASYVRPEVAADAYVEFSLDRALVCFARAVAAYKSGGSWPESVSAEYLKPTGATVGDFARQFVGILTVWQNTTGDIQVVDGDKFEGVHYVPADYKITVGGTDYNKSAIYEIAAQSLKTLAEDNGTFGAPLPVVHSYDWAPNPYNEGIGNGGPLTPEEVSLAFLLNYAGRQLTWAGNNRMWSNFCGYTAGQVAGYGGCCCLERNLLTMARFYKHLLDNDITENVATACADTKFDATLY